MFLKVEKLLQSITLVDCNKSIIIWASASLHEVSFVNINMCLAC